MIKGTAPMRLELGFNGDEMDFVHLVNDLAMREDGVGLDSMDAGDAMGWVITQTMMNDCELHIEEGGFILLATISFDSFRWGGDGMKSEHTPID
jgi:hypothetical protein